MKKKFYFIELISTATPENKNFAGDVHRYVYGKGEELVAFEMVKNVSGDADYKDKGEVYVAACFYEPGISDFIRRHIAKRYAKNEDELKKAKESFYLEFLPQAAGDKAFTPDDIDGWISIY